MRFARSRVGPGQYLISGVVLFLTKFATDRVVASAVFGRAWSPLNYLVPNETYSLASLPPDERHFYLAMLAVATPFAIVGLLLTIGRLRDARLTTVWAALFFVPVVNLLFFAVLSILPSHRPARRVDTGVTDAAGGDAETQIAAAEAPPSPPVDLAYRSPETPVGEPAAAPRSNIASFAISALLGGLLAPLLVLLGVMWLQNYGWGLFVGAPFVVGFVAATLHELTTPRSTQDAISVSVAAGAIGIAATLLLALEGLGCLIMLLPLALPLTIIGGSVGHSIQQGRHNAAYRSIVALLVCLPLVMGAERLAREPAHVFKATTSIVIDAPPAVVWEHVVHFGEIAPPREWLFRTGIAYPIRARIDGSGVGAVRYCEFSTGPFVEPITTWDAPRLLKFDVTHNPPPLREWGPFDIHPPHLENFLMSHGGQFALVDLGDGRTRVEGTTWYQHTMWPETYWSWWSDYVIHRIHTRVLEHVKTESESALR